MRYLFDLQISGLLVILQKMYILFSELRLVKDELSTDVNHEHMLSEEISINRKDLAL